MSWQALVEGTDVSAYGITRSLGRKGLGVAAINEECDDVLRHSKYCKLRATYPIDPTQQHAYAGDRLPNAQVMCDLLLQLAKQASAPPVLYATSDWFARLLSTHSSQLSGAFRYHWIPETLFNSIADKGQMASICQRAGVDVPATHVTSEANPIPGHHPYPSVVKPLHRYTVPFPGPSKVFVAKDRDMLMRFFEQHPHLLGNTLVQEMIEGGDDTIFQCTALVGNDGNIGPYATVRKIRQYRPGYGSMCYGRTEPNEQVRESGFRLLEALEYRGLGSLEFKYRARDQKYYFIEMNARLPWYNGIFADAGVNFAYYAYRDLIGNPVKQFATQRHNTYWMSARENRYWYSETPEMPGKAWSMMKSMAGCDSYAWWNWRDPMPSLMTAANFVSGVGGKLMLRRTSKA